MMKEPLASSLDRLQDHWDRQSELPDDARRVDFSPRTQRMRFEAFLYRNDLQGRTVLDLGCGVGAFYEHLKRRRIDCDYTGFDLSPRMIALCRERYPEAVFHSGNILEWGRPEGFDFSVAFGIHNIRMDDGWEILCRVTRRQFELSRIAAHVSLLTDRYRGFGADIQPWRAERVLEMALEITPYVSLQHDVLPNDFSVTLYREPLIDTAPDPLLDYEK